MTNAKTTEAHETHRIDALVTALETAAGSSWLARLPSVPVCLRAEGTIGQTTVLATVHSGDSVTINAYSVTPAAALRIVQLLAEVLP